MTLHDSIILNEPAIDANGNTYYTMPTAQEAQSITGPKVHCFYGIVVHLLTLILLEKSLELFVHILVISHLLSLPLIFYCSPIFSSSTAVSSSRPLPLSLRLILYRCPIFS